eukprot:365509-Chlamydomonas_euryale.AAC.10
MRGCERIARPYRGLSSAGVVRNCGAARDAAAYTEIGFTRSGPGCLRLSSTPPVQSSAGNRPVAPVLNSCPHALTLRSEMRRCTRPWSDPS